MLNINNSFFNYSKHILPNNLEVIIWPRKEFRQVAIHAVVGAGSMHDTSNKIGLAHFTEHMLHRGTAHFKNYGEISEYVAKNGGMFNANTKFDEAEYKIILPSENIENGIHYLSEILCAPTFKDFEAEKNHILEEIIQVSSLPRHQLFQKVKTIRYGSSSAFNNPTVGKIDCIKSVLRDDAASFYKNYYQASNIKLFIIGNCSPKKLLEHIKRYFRFEKSKSQKFPKPQIPNYRSNSSPVTLKNNSNTLVGLNFTGFEMSNTSPKNRFLLSLVKGILNDNRFSDSLLRSEIIKNKSLTKDINFSSLCQTWRRLNIIYAELDAKDINQFITTCNYQIDRLLSTSAGRKLFEILKKNAVDSYLTEFDSLPKSADWIIQYEKESSLKSSYYDPSELLEQIKFCTYADLQAVAKRLFIGK